MTQVASPETVKGNFNNVTLEFAGRTYRLERRGEEFWVDMVDPDWARAQAIHQQQFQLGQRSDPPPGFAAEPRAKKRITMLTGSHHMQAYWVASKNTNTQLSLPFTYLFEDQKWAPRPDVFLRDPKMTPEPQYQMWNSNCLRCHSTAGEPGYHDNRAGSMTRVGELGISCEACHGPAKEHVANNRDLLRRYHLHKDDKGDPTIVQPARLDHVKSSEACGQCHSLSQTIQNKEWMQHGYRFKPGGDLESDRALIRLTTFKDDKRFPENFRKHPEALDGFFWPDGMIRVSGREYTGLLETPCYQRGTMSCLSCHSMHQSDPNDQLAFGMDGNNACLQCHDEMSAPAKIEEHTRHKINSSGSLCYNCHMPYTTFGLLKGIRSHMVTSPGVKSQLDTGRPNACNLCHLDKTLEWTATNLTSWHKIPAPELPTEEKKYSSSALMALRGDAGQRALIAYHMGWDASWQVSGTNWMIRYLGQLLEDPYSAVRYVARRSMRSLPEGKGFKFDYLASPEERKTAHDRATQLLRPLTLPESLAIPQGEFDRFLKQRNDRSMELLE